MIARRLVLALVIFPLAGGACAQTQSRPVDFGEVSHEYRGRDYLSVHDTWTRRAKLVRDVGTVIEAWATYKSWDFRQAYVAYYSEIYSLSDADRAALLQSQLEASRATYEFHLIVQTTSDRWNDLDRRTSPWRMTLLDGTGAELSPTSITVAKLPELYESQFFPERTEFSRTYVVTFSHPVGQSDGFVGAASGRLQLRIASPMGSVDMTWEAK
jgi:hypothetical protein